MDEYPAQSHKSREQRQIQPVTTGEARIREAPWGRKLRENFIQASAPSVWRTMLWDVLLPGARDVISDGLHEGVDLFLSGRGNGGGFRRTNRYGGSSQSLISKHNPDRALGGRPQREAPDARDRHDMNVYEIDSRVEAEEVLTQMNMLIDEYDICTFADFLQMVRITPAHTDYKFGWESIADSRVIHSRGSYYLDLPRPIQIK
jgi:hypothetical protein